MIDDFDNRFPHQPKHNMLSTFDMNERVYPTFKYKGDEDAAVEAVDSFIKRMAGNHEAWKKGEWLVEYDEVMRDMDLYPVEIDFQGSIYIDEERMGNEIDTLLSNFGG